MVQEFAASAVGALLALLPITNPVGAVPIFYSLTADLPTREQQRQARLTAVWSVGVLLLFLITGRLILEFFGISLGVGAFNRVLGFFILAIAVQMVVDGSFSVLAAYLPDLFSSPTTVA